MTPILNNPKGKEDSIKGNETDWVDHVKAMLHRRYPVARIALGIIAIIVVMAISAGRGAIEIPIDVVAIIIMDKLRMAEPSADLPSVWETIVWNIRLPRVITAGIVGSALALSGATFQGIFRNPLADPYLIGVASGAGLAVTIIIISPIPNYLWGINLLPPVAFLGALLAVAIAYLLSNNVDPRSTNSLVLAGVAVTFMASSMTTFLMLQASPDMRPILNWLLGGVSQGGWDRPAWLLPYVLPCGIFIMLHSRTLNVLQLDRDHAMQLGINVDRTKVSLIVCASLATAAAVSVSGMIPFVGLMAPHCVRLLWGGDHRNILPMSTVVGALLLIFSDMLARTILSPEELPVGVITAFFGAPFFVLLLRRNKTLGEQV